MRIKRNLSLLIYYLPSLVFCNSCYPSNSSVLIGCWDSAQTFILDSTVQYTLSVPLVVLSGKTKNILATNASNPPIISGQNLSRIFQVHEQAQLILQDVILQEGQASVPYSSDTIIPPSGTGTGGGCISVYGEPYGSFASSLSLTRVTFQNCNTYNGSGGAIGFWGSDASSLSMINSTFINNIADQYGGAVFLTITGQANQVQVSGSEFVNNTATQGGAFFVDVGAKPQTVFDQCHFSYNLALTNGSCIYFNDNSFPLQVFQSAFSYNDALGSGYAITLSAANAELEMDNTTAFIMNHGIDGNHSGVISCSSSSCLIAIIPLPTSQPTSSPSLSTFSPLPPSPNNRNPPSNDVGLIAAVATGVIAIFLSAAVFALWIFYGRRSRRQLVQAALEQQQQHINFMRNRARAAQRPLIVRIGRHLPVGETHEECLVCQSEVAPTAIIGKAMLTLSAVGAGLTTPAALGNTFVRLACEHGFHAACIIEWCEVYENETCPICRTVVAVRNNHNRGSSTDDSSIQGGSFSGGRRSNAAAGSGGGFASPNGQTNTILRPPSRTVSGGEMIGTARNSILRRSSQNTGGPVTAVDQNQLIPLVQPESDHIV